MNPEGNITPAALGYRMPAEWEPHSGTWLSWPHNPDTWSDKLDAAERALAEAVRALGEGEVVHINVLDGAHEGRVRAILEAVGAQGVGGSGGIAGSGGVDASAFVRFHPIPTNDSWCRDHGAIFVTNPKADEPLAATAWRFNAWGGKYPPWDLDDAVADRMALELGVPRFRYEIVLEGGAIDVNGAGLLMTTASCLLDPARNEGKTRNDWETILKGAFGVERILWLGGELEGDDTDGHIDNLARFVDERTVVAVDPDHPASARTTEESGSASDAGPDPGAGLRTNLRILREASTLDGRTLEVRSLPLPDPVFVDGKPMPASYANFYIGNAVVLLPRYGVSQDGVARAIVEELFPGRRVVDVDCRALIWGLGAFHCLSQQVPAV